MQAVRAGVRARGVVARGAVRGGAVGAGAARVGQLARGVRLLHVRRQREDGCETDLPNSYSILIYHFGL